MYLLCCVLLWLSLAHGLRVAPGYSQPRALVRHRAVMQETAEASVDETKKNVRRRIMSKDSYKRGGTPFEKTIHKDVAGKMSELFAGELVEKMKESSFRELVVGEGDRQITFVLAKEFGFCWGVERSIELAWAAREQYPDKTMHITHDRLGGKSASRPPLGAHPLSPPGGF